ncbi:helix-turn-helix transcriptional regulator [Candidatus Nitrospira bockiana]
MSSHPVRSPGRPHLRLAFTRSHDSPGLGIIILTPGLEMVYMNHEARELSERMNKQRGGQRARGVIPREIIRLGTELSKLLLGQSLQKDLEQVQLSRLSEHRSSPVRLRGYCIPNTDDIRQSRLLILIDEVVSSLAPPLHTAKDRFNLTDREQSIIAPLFRGLTNKQIAEELGITDKTVKQHIRQIMQKTKSPTRTAILGNILTPTMPPIGPPRHEKPML